MAQADRPPHDLVLCARYPQENRWKSNDELVNSKTLRKLTPDLWLKENFKSLRRVKITEAYPREQMIELLTILSGPAGPADNLSVLEIDTLTFREGDSISCAFAGLELLSVDRVFVIAQDEENPAEEIILPEGFHTTASILFDTPALRKVYLGASSIRYVRFAQPQNITFLSADQDHTGDHLAEFENLEVLECNQIEEFNLSTISQFIAGELGRLTELHCWMAYFQSTHYAPGADQVAFLERFYGSLRRAANVECPPDFGPGNFMLRGIRDDLRIFLNGVQLDLQRLEFAEYHFDDFFLSMRCHNERANELAVQPCRTAFETDYLDLVELFQPAEGLVGFMRFAVLYPNVRKIRVRQPSNAQMVIQPAELFHVFAFCRGLLVLEFENCAFHANFYDQLVRMQYCRSLTHLTILESVPFVDRIDFGFLTSLTFLHQFETNAAPRDLMLDCLMMMEPPTQRFVFRFGHKAGQTRRRFIFFRVTKLMWAMSEEILKDGTFEAIAWHSLSLKPMKWNKLLEHFNRPEQAQLTAHWIAVDPSHVPRSPDLSSGKSTEKSLSPNDANSH